MDEGPEWWAKTPDVDGWPDHLMPEGTLDRAALGVLMTDHYRAAGSKNRDVTFDVLEAATGLRDIDQVEEQDYDAVARALLRDTAKYEFGIKAPAKAPTKGK